MNRLPSNGALLTDAWARVPMNLLLKCADLEETKAFYAEILEFEVSASAERTCTVQKAGGTIIFTDEQLWEGHPTAPERSTFTAQCRRIL